MRNKIINLKNVQLDYNEKIIQFYDQFTQRVVTIQSEKKKQQLIEASKIYEFKDKIVDQYCKLAQIEKINQCLIQENKQTILIEQDLKQIIDHQFSQQNEYTSILSTMIKQYELINQFDLVKPNQIKENIFKILETINVIPQNNFNFSDEADIFRIESFEIFKKKVQKEYKIHQNNSIIQKTIMNLLNDIKGQLILQNYPLNILKDCYFNQFISISNRNNSSSYISAQLCPYYNFYSVQRKSK
ncbi:hypothetical protein ABPG72_021235 [Tetrahymena utriculariae]